MLLSLTLVVLVTVFKVVVANEDPVESMIYPKDGTKKDQVAIITKDLQALIPDEKKRYQSKSDNLEATLFWWGFLTEKQCKEFQDKHQDSVAVVIQRTPKTDALFSFQGPAQARKRVTPNKIDVREGAFDDLKIISLPKGVKLDDPKYLGYYYDRDAGKDTMVYVVDSGAAIDHVEFDDVRDQIKWIWAAPKPATNSKTDGGKDFHGTSMTSKVVGKNLGAAPKAQITVVRTTDSDNRETVELSLDALLKTYDDIKKNQAGKTVVVSISWVLRPYPDNKAYSDAYFGAMKYVIGELLKLDVIITNSAGNDKKDVSITATPPILGKDNTALLVNGGILDDGSQDPNTQLADWVKVFAPSKGVIVATDPKGTIEYNWADGTSPGAAMVAGVVACLLTSGTSKSDIPKKIYDLAYSRKEGGPNVLYNGIDFRNMDSKSINVHSQGHLNTPPRPTSSSPPAKTTSPAPTPSAAPPDEDSCDVAYKFFLDKFEVRGKNFPDDKLGKDGEGLKKQIQGCGAITDWHFDLTPKDTKYQWYAYGNLPIGTKNCVGNAVKSAGGSTNGNCHGPG